MSTVRPPGVPTTRIDTGTRQTEQALAEYLSRYTTENSQQTVNSRLRGLIRVAGKSDLFAVTEADVATWIQSAKSNNTARSYLAAAKSFYRWALKHGYVDSDPSDDLDHLRRSYPRTYGKVQSANPARFLTYNQAYNQLLGACRTGSQTGKRDEIAIRLGLLGMRAAEICALRVGDLDLDRPQIAWTGKGRKPRTMTPGPSLVQLIAEHLANWAQATGTTPTPTAPLLPTVTTGTRRQGGIGRLDYGKGMGYRTLYDLVTTRAREAGLGHVAPHDLRRTAASILHNDKTETGGHRFDLLDVQHVLGHTDPAITMRCYLEPMDTETCDRASTVLD